MALLATPKAMPWDKTLGQPEGEQEVQSTSGAAVYLDLPSMNVMRVFPASHLALKPPVHFPGAIPSTRGGFEVGAMQNHTT